MNIVTFSGVANEARVTSSDAETVTTATKESTDLSKAQKTIWFGLVVAPRASLEKLPSKVTAFPCAS